MEPPGFNPRALVVYGGGGHGKAVIDLVRATGTYEVVAVVDDGLPAGTQVLGVPVVGGAEALRDLAAQGVRLAANAVGGIHDLRVRVAIFDRLQEAGFACPTLVHPSAVVEPSARLAAGAQVFPLAYVGGEASIGFGTIVNTAAVVSHDCRIGDYVILSPGARLAGGVTVGERALLGMGVTVNLNLTVGAGARIGNGATVKRDVPEGAVVHAGAVWPE